METTPFIAYLVQRFPALRTTFIRREVESLRRNGVPLKVISMRRAKREDLCGDKEAEAHLSTTEPLPVFPLDPESIWANVQSLVLQPWTYIRTWRFAFGDPGDSGLGNRLKLLLQIWRGAVVARRLRRVGGCRRVHAQFADGAATTGLVAANLLGVPFSFMSHTSHKSPLIVEKLRASCFVGSISEYDKRRLISLGGAGVAPCIRIIHCGIPIASWPYRERHSRSGPLRIVSVGALIETKGHDALIGACATLRDQGIDFLCEIVGSGSLKADLDELTKRLHLEGRVRLLGPLPQSEVRKRLYEADLFVLACRTATNGDTEGIPVSIMEAMAVGVPVVSTRSSGIPELVPDTAGWLVEPDDPIALAQAMHEALADLDQSKVVAARRWVEENFSQEVEARKLAELLGYPGLATAAVSEPLCDGRGGPDRAKVSAGVGME